MSNQVMNVSPVGEDAIEYLNRLLTEEEQQEVEIAVMLMQTVRPERKARRLSQAELERLCGVSASTISLIENGDLTSSLTVVAKVLSVLGKRLYIGNMIPDFGSRNPRSRMKNPISAREMGFCTNFQLGIPGY